MWFNRLIPTKNPSRWNIVKAFGLLALVSFAPSAIGLTLDMPDDATMQGFMWGVLAAVVVTNLLHFVGTAQKVFLLLAAVAFWGALALAGGGSSADWSESQTQIPAIARAWQTLRVLAAPLALCFFILLSRAVSKEPEANSLLAHAWRWLPVAGLANVAIALVIAWSGSASALLPLCTATLLVLATGAFIYVIAQSKLWERWLLALLLCLALTGLASAQLDTKSPLAWPIDQAIFSVVAVIAAFWLANQRHRRAIAAYQAQLMTTESQRVALEKFKLAEGALEAKVSKRTHELHLAVQRLETLSAQDGLTGVANRRRFDEVLKVECGRAARSRQALSVALIDVDWFGAFNSHYGHERGDACLCKLARVLESGVMRSGDLIARYSGGVFVLLAPDTDANGITSIANYLCQEVFGLELPNADSPYGRVSISVGVATSYPPAGDTPDRLVQRAAAGLVNAKRQGRHRVVAG